MFLILLNGNYGSGVFSGFRRVVNKIFALLRGYTAWIGGYVAAFRDNLSAPSSRVTEKENATSPSSLDYLILDVGTDRLSRNVGKYKFTLRNIPEEQRSQCLSGKCPVVMMIEMLMVVGIHLHLPFLIAVSWMCDGQICHSSGKIVMSVDVS
jgi:hypothetical protein